jgi:hypothetical protein
MGDTNKMSKETECKTSQEQSTTLFAPKRSVQHVGVGSLARYTHHAKAFLSVLSTHNSTILALTFNHFTSFHFVPRPRGHRPPPPPPPPPAMPRHQHTKARRHGGTEALVHPPAILDYHFPILPYLTTISPSRHT